MEWYYAVDGQQHGPVGERELQQLIADGVIADNTLVWNATFGDWQAFANVRDTVPWSTHADAPEATDVTDGYCSVCGTPAAPGDLNDIDGGRVCPACRLSRSYSRSDQTTEAEYGGFWVRLAAKFLDGIIVVFPAFVLISVPCRIWLFILARQGEDRWLTLALVAAVELILHVLVRATYTAGFLGRFGATPGKMACRLRVVGPDHTRLTYARAAARYFAELLDLFTLLLGYVIAAFDSEKRALHDHICDTRVVYR